MEEEADGGAHPATGPVLQLKVRLLEISPMVWRRLLVPVETTLHELHGILQVALGWEGIHLFQFHLRAIRYGSPELSAAAAAVPLAGFRLRIGSRFAYECTTSTSPGGTRSGSSGSSRGTHGSLTRPASTATATARPRIAADRPAALPGSTRPWVSTR